MMGILAINLQAQKQADIQQIRKWYNTTKKKIEFSKKSKKSTLYCIILEKNAYNTEGASYMKQQFWCNFESTDTRAGLDMVIINADYYYSEYLYHKGQLVFVFSKDEINEHRFYFKNSQLLKQISGNKVGEGMISPTPKSVLQNAEDYMHQYLSNFCTSNK